MQQAEQELAAIEQQEIAALYSWPRFFSLLRNLLGPRVPMSGRVCRGHRVCATVSSTRRRWFLGRPPWRCRRRPPPEPPKRKSPSSWSQSQDLEFEVLETSWFVCIYIYIHTHIIAELTTPTCKKLVTINGSNLMNPIYGYVNIFIYMNNKGTYRKHMNIWSSRKWLPNQVNDLIQSPEKETVQEDMPKRFSDDREPLGKVHVTTSWKPSNQVNLDFEKSSEFQDFELKEFVCFNTFRAVSACPKGVTSAAAAVALHLWGQMRLMRSTSSMRPMRSTKHSPLRLTCRPKVKETSTTKMVRNHLIAMVSLAFLCLLEKMAKIIFAKASPLRQEPHGNVRVCVQSSLGVMASRPKPVGLQQDLLKPKHRRGFDVRNMSCVLQNSN